ncbi:MAG: inositol monophosphatase [Chloroflexota bacterium]
MQPTLETLETLARQAGEILRAGFGNHTETNFKGEIDLVTEVDHQAEVFLLGKIRKAFPGQKVIAEESGGLDGNEEDTWYIDPIDGTTNFAHGVPIFGVSIAYSIKGQVQFGVVYNPILEEMYKAQLGVGAWLNDKKIRVSQTTELKKSLLVTGFPYDRFDNPRNNLDEFNKLTLRAQGMRRLGSAALDLCFVAAGRVDGYWEIRLAPWDVAAGLLIAREAGARVTRMQGIQDFLQSPCSVVAANPILHQKILNVLQEKD